MEKRNFSNKEIEELIYNHPGFEKIKGTYVFSTNTSSNSYLFHSTQQDILIFIENIIEALMILSPVIATNAPLEWAPLPGVNKDDILKKFQAEPHLYLEFLQSDVSLLVIKKISDEGKIIYWEQKVSNYR